MTMNFLCGCLFFLRGGGGGGGQGGEDENPIYKRNLFPFSPKFVNKLLII